MQKDLDQHPCFFREKELTTSTTSKGVLPISKSTLWRLIKADMFPEALSFGATVAWRVADVDAWLIKHMGVNLKGELVNRAATGLPKVLRSTVEHRNNGRKAKTASLTAA